MTMASSRYQSSRPVGSSPRPKTRESKDTLCRNVLIYGHCRYEDQGCAFSHDQNRTIASQAEITKKTLNVESPSFTPASIQPTTKKAGLTTGAASAPSFTPRGIGTPTSESVEPDTGAFNPATIREFTPGFDISQANSTSSQHDGSVNFDFTPAAMAQGIPASQFNPYAEDHSSMTAAGSAFYQGPGAYSTPPQPLQHHLYFPEGPRREDLLPYQRLTHDFFMPESIRIEMAKKQEAAGQIMHNSQLPQLDNYHSLVPLDTSHRKNASIFGYPSWVYKAFSTKSGHLYSLRRLEGYRLSNEHAIRSVKEWRRIHNANIVSVIDAFTTRAFGDSSLIFVQNYYPLSKTLAEVHLSSAPTAGNRIPPKTVVQESILWTYIVQIANALKAIHENNLAARCIDPSKIILSGKNHIRLAACSVLDVVQFENRRPLQELQQEDFVQFGKTMLCLATGTAAIHLTNLKTSVEQMARLYSPELRDTVVWLLSPQQAGTQKGIEEFMRGISGQVMATMDQTMLQNDQLEDLAAQEVQHGRISRLMMKLNTINERFDFGGDQSWSENGERYLLKLFRDYVFHQVDSNGNPVLDIGHMIRCMTKLDAGSEDRICLVSRDEQTAFVVSYSQLKKQLNNSFVELLKASKQKSSAF